MFNFFKKKKETVPEWRRKVEKVKNLSGFQESQLMSYIKDVMSLDLISKVKRSENEKLTKFTIDLVQKFEKLRNTEQDPTGWVLLPDKLFENFDSEEKGLIISILKPVEDLSIAYLNTIVEDLPKLMRDIEKHKQLAKQYAEFRAAGGHISQDREFIGEWVRKISPHWFGIAHFLYDIKN
ncbi:MAG: hypothetical protein ACJ77K_18455 [Bacteroidia bacterium]